MTGPTLTAPFAHTSELTKGGRTFTYIPSPELIERLNAVLGYFQWSYECDLVHLNETFVVVKGRLSVQGAVYEQFGGQRINKNKQGEVIDLGDDFKGAASDAEKKCAAQIGVGLYLSLGRGPTPAVLTSAGEDASRGSGAPPGGDSSGNPAAAEEEPAPQQSSSAKSSGGGDQGDPSEQSVSSSQRETSAAPTGIRDKSYTAEKPLAEARAAVRGEKK